VPEAAALSMASPDGALFEKTPLYPYQSKIVPFFVELSRKLFATDVIAGFHFIAEASYDGDSPVPDKLDHSRSEDA